MFLLCDRVRRRGEYVSTGRRIKLLTRLQRRTPLQTLAQRIRCSVWKARRSGRLDMEAGAKVGRRALIQCVQCSWNCAGGGAAPTSAYILRLVPMPSLPARVDESLQPV